MSDGTVPQIDGLTFVKKLGSGGFADVFLYDETNPERAVAVKVMRDSGLSTKTIRKFAAEANAMAKLEHTYIVPVYSTGTTKDGRPYIKMRYYPRPSLAERARRERFSVAETIQLGIQLGSAIETAHRSGLLHRDIKPANVLTNANGKPGLTDFGIAGQITDEDDPETGVSVPWSPPETLYGSAPASVRSDVYSLAATLWHLLVGRSPFEMPGGDNSAFAMMKRVRDLPPPSTGRAEVPNSLDRLLRAAMSKDPAARPSTVREFIGALQAIEQELRLPRTEAELLDEPVAHTSMAPQPMTDATIARTPQVVAPERHVAPRYGSTVEQATVRRDSVHQLVGSYRDEVEGATVLRSDRASTDADREREAEADETRPRRLVLVIVASLLLIVAVAVGLFLTLGQPKAQSRTTPTITQVQPDLNDGVPPGIPTIAATRADGQVKFSWRYSSSLPNDQVQWRVKGTTNVTVAGPDGTASVPAPASGQVCVQVRVARMDGSSVQREWTEGCG